MALGSCCRAGQTSFQSASLTRGPLCSSSPALAQAPQQARPRISLCRAGLVNASCSVYLPRRAFRLQQQARQLRLLSWSGVRRRSRGSSTPFIQACAPRLRSPCFSPVLRLCLVPAGLPSAQEADAVLEAQGESAWRVAVHVSLSAPASTQVLLPLNLCSPAMQCT